MDNPAGQQMEVKLGLSHDNRMTRVIPPRTSGNHITLLGDGERLARVRLIRATPRHGPRHGRLRRAVSHLGENVDELAFPLVTPLGAEDNFDAVCPFFP